MLTALGKGVIICLSGPPGVGKTLTAESSRSRLHEKTIRERGDG